MEKKFIFYAGWYYPIESVSFHINAHDKSVSMFHLSEGDAVALFTGEKAKAVQAFLLELSFNFDRLHWHEGNED